MEGYEGDEALKQEENVAFLTTNVKLNDANSIGSWKDSVERRDMTDTNSLGSWGNGANGGLYSIQTQ